MSVETTYHVYILTNRSNRVLYTGVTNDLFRRVHEHRSGEGGSFTRRYNVHRLVYYETGPSSREAIQREKQIKAGPRARKVALVNAMNPAWLDLAAEWFD